VGVSARRREPRPYVSADIVTDDTIEWLSTVDGPFFAWAHYMDVHHPCFLPESYRAAHGVAGVTQASVADWCSALVSDPDRLTDDSIEALESLYDAAVEYTCDQIGRIVDHLEETGKLEETVIVVTSDHGELFGDHGGYGKPERMYDELLRVPCTSRTVLRPWRTRVMNWSAYWMSRRSSRTLSA
jgi:arylsulfatase A-like enzyme